MTLLGGCNAVELEKLLLVVGVLEGVEVLVAGAAGVDVGVRLTLETPKSGAGNVARDWKHEFWSEFALNCQGTRSRLKNKET